jgi:hypothetical protein
VWCREVDAAIERSRPKVAVGNAGGQLPLQRSHGMTTADVAEIAARVPTAVAVHLEAMNNCPMTRAELRAALPRVLVPADGETLGVVPS